jgi:hypothetical protein
MVPPFPHSSSSGSPVSSAFTVDRVRPRVDQPGNNRLVAAARDAAATDAATAAAAERDGGHGATDHLGRLLSTVPVIEQARGLLMGFYGIGADRAFDLLVRWSQTTNTKLVRISETLVTAASTPRSADEPFAGLQDFLDNLGLLLNQVGPSSSSDRTELGARRLRSTGQRRGRVAGSRRSPTSPSTLFPTSSGLDEQQEASAGG